MDPVALRIGPLTVYWYGLLIVIGAILAAVIATFEARRRGENTEHVWNVLTYCLILGIIGARLYHVFSSPEGGFVGWSYYKEHPIDIIAFWRGGFRGLGIYGAVAGGVVAVILYCYLTNRSLRRNRATATQLLSAHQETLDAELVQASLAADLSTPENVAEQSKRLGSILQRAASLPSKVVTTLQKTIASLGERDLALLRWLDILTPGLLLAQAIGRVGNFINQELYGQPTNLPWGLAIDCEHRYGAFTCDKVPEGTRFHPTFFYEAAWNLVGFGLIMWLGRKWRRHLRDGDVFLFYLIWYPLGRFWVEFFRPDAWLVGGTKLATAQLIALICIIFAIIALVLRHRFWTPAAEVKTAGAATGSDAPAARAEAIDEPEAAAVDSVAQQTQPDEDEPAAE